MALGFGGKIRVQVLGPGPAKLLKRLRNVDIDQPSGKVPLHTMDPENLIGFFQGDRVMNLTMTYHVLKGDSGIEFDFSAAALEEQNYALQIYVGNAFCVAEGQFTNNRFSGASDNPTEGTVEWTGVATPIN